MSKRVLWVVEAKLPDGFGYRPMPFWSGYTRKDARHRLREWREHWKEPVRLVKYVPEVKP